MPEKSFGHQMKYPCGFAGLLLLGGCYCQKGTDICVEEYTYPSKI